jgi:hypothetical protein
MSRGFVLVLLAMLIPVAGVCKCGNIVIYLEGHVSGGDSHGLEIVAETTPDANWQPQPKIRVKQGGFAGEVYFDRTIPSKEWFRDICTRVPKSVEIRLLRGGHQLDSIRLDISNDFVRDEFGDYKLRSPIEFHLR